MRAALNQNHENPRRYQLHGRSLNSSSHTLPRSLIKFGLLFFVYK